MKIFFTASYQGKQQHQSAYDKILESIKDAGDEIISLEVGKYEDYLGASLVKRIPKEKLHYTYIRKGINMANAVVIETSEPSFQLGHEATLALLYNKPVLCIAHSSKINRINVYDPKFKVSFYSEEQEIITIVKDFLEEVRDNSLSVRFNMKISPIQKNFLDWYADKHKKNSSQILRDRIDEMLNEHPDYFDDLNFIPYSDNI